MRGGRLAFMVIPKLIKRKALHPAPRAPATPLYFFSGTGSREMRMRDAIYTYIYIPARRSMQRSANVNISLCARKRKLIIFFSFFVTGKFHRQLAVNGF